MNPLAIVGSTAVGKSALAMQVGELARDDGLDVELISADSMQVYRHMDIGTAKPTPAERRAVQHHLIDVVEPSETFDVATFQRLATDALRRIEAANRVAIVVGGTGLYHRSLIDNLDIPGRYDHVRAQLEAEPDTESLYARLVTLDATAAARTGPANRRRIVRALEVCLGSGRAFSSYGPGLTSEPPSRFLQIGLGRSRRDTRRRVESRVETMIDQGLVGEVLELLERHGPLSRTAAQALGYRELAEAVRGEASLRDAIAATKLRTQRFAVRQERWFRRDSRVEWIDAEHSLSALARQVYARWVGHEVPRNR